MIAEAVLLVGGTSDVLEIFSPTLRVAKVSFRQCYVHKNCVFAHVAFRKSCAHFLSPCTAATHGSRETRSLWGQLFVLFRCVVVVFLGGGCVVTCFVLSKTYDIYSYEYRIFWILAIWACFQAIHEDCFLFR